jgi:hypothetical protein
MGIAHWFRGKKQAKQDVLPPEVNSQLQQVQSKDAKPSQIPPASPDSAPRSISVQESSDEKVPCRKCGAMILKRMAVLKDGCCLKCSGVKSVFAPQNLSTDTFPEEAQTQKVKTPVNNLLEFLIAGKGTDELYEMLRTHPVSDIEELCGTFPFETLRIDWDHIKIKSNFPDSKKFEMITVLAQILIQYDEILGKSPELHLPSSFPAKQLADTLMSRLMPFIHKQQNVDIAQHLRLCLYDFAIALMQADRYYSDGLRRNRDALSCLLASRPSLKEDHDFAICACLCNIANITKASNDIKLAIDFAEQIVSARIKVPDRYIKAAGQMLSQLRSLSVSSENGARTLEQKKEIYLALKKTWEEERHKAYRQTVDNVRVRPGEDPFKAMASATIGRIMSGSLETQTYEIALKKVAARYGLTMEEFAAIEQEGKTEGWDK